ncbi:MAG: hypothetical protein FWC34_04490 [Bacteroidetes bacterium]|nr:hypothetical protein [Bacteroidota bacterium]MCL2302704.1 hypothetical protein [Lentimicrobiaceae bacterium]
MELKTGKQNVESKMVFSDKAFLKANATNRSNPLPLPFFEDFLDAGSLTKWTIIDGDGDGDSWMWEEWGAGPDEIGSAIIYGPNTHATNDYLISPPLIFAEPGNHYVSFYTFAMNRRQ